MKIAVPDRYRPLLSPGLEPDPATYRDADELMSAVADADALWLNFMSPEATQRAIEHGHVLRWVSTVAAGVERLPLQLMKERGIVLTNGAGLAATPIAEYVVLGMLAAAKGFPELVRAQDRRVWLDRPPARGELHGTRALVIGFGGIGRAVASRLEAFGVAVTGVRRHPSDDQPNILAPDAWRTRLDEYDWVILTTPLTPETRHLIGAGELDRMRTTAWLVNISRGALIDTAALIDALSNNQIGGAYLDVHEAEPLPSDHPLWLLPNVILTPHSSWATDRLDARAVTLFEANLERFKNHQPLRNTVNLDRGY